MQRNGVVILASVALAAVAIIVAAYIFTHKPEPEGPSAYEQSIERAHEQRVACLEGGGTWDEFLGCQQPIQTAVPPAPSTSDGGASSGGATIGGGRLSVEEYVDQTWSVAEQAGFCVAVEGLGYATALRQWTHGNPVSYPPPKKVFMELFSRCL